MQTLPDTVAAMGMVCPFPVAQITHVGDEDWKTTMSVDFTWLIKSKFI